VRPVLLLELFYKSYRRHLIDGQSYKIISNCNDSLMTKWSEIRYIREVNQKVYYLKKNDDSECLLYDFNCKVGDTLNLDCWCLESEIYFEVDSIIVKPLLDENRKHFYLSYLNNISKEIWIEGIGSIGGILNGGGPNNCMTGGSQNLLCCYQNGIEIYHDPEYDDCYLGSKVVNSVNIYSSQNQFLVYPNPAKNEINIQIHSNEQILSLELVDLKGNPVYQNCKVLRNIFKLDVSEFPKGNYILIVETESSKISRQVVIL
jgi:hypothetical protein